MEKNQCVPGGGALRVARAVDMVDGSPRAPSRPTPSKVKLALAQALENFELALALQTLLAENPKFS